MTQATITTIKKDSITLPKAWKGSQVFMRVTGNTATITKLPGSKIIFSQNEINAFRKLGKKISPTILQRALKS